MYQHLSMYYTYNISNNKYQCYTAAIQVYYIMLYEYQRARTGREKGTSTAVVQVTQVKIIIVDFIILG